MKDHAQFADDLALYAMGALDDQACPELQAHLGTCGECRRELEALRADMALLALSATGPQPPQRSRQRLMEALAAKSLEVQAGRPVSAPVRQWPRWLFWAPLAACVVLIVHTGFLMNAHHQDRIAYDTVVTELQAERKDNARAQEILAMLKDPKAQQLTLVAKKTPPQPQVKIIYVQDKGHVLLIANNVSELPADKAYQLWLLPAKGGDPMSAGTFKTDWRGHGMKLHYMQTAGIDAKGFAVTIEPEAGSETPTMPIVLEPGN
jgi:anti-sigma-K factor RskA